MAQFLLHEIKNALNLGNNIIAWNLKKMLEFGLIKEIQFKKKRIYSSKEFSDQKAIIYYYVKKKDELKFILLELNKNSLNFEELANRMDIIKIY